VPLFAPAVWEWKKWPTGTDFKGEFTSGKRERANLSSERSIFPSEWLEFHREGECGETVQLTVLEDNGNILIANLRRSGSLIVFAGTIRN
jgi:hypothetical protein